MRKLSICLVVLGFFQTARADHITGGEMYYYYTGFSNGQYNYNGTLKLLMRCNSGRQFNDPTVISVFDKATNNRISDTRVPLSRKETLQLTTHDKCITNPPIVCYEVGYYEFSISVPASLYGYIISGQVNYRVAGINNLTAGYAAIGATYTAEIPGTSASNDNPKNTSGRFVASDLVEICAGNSFSYSFAAEDNDGDNLRYSFCEAYQSGTSGGPNTSNPPLSPPYGAVPYGTNYGGSSPLGSTVQIDANTGLISGVAPPESGIYVVTVCITEIRNGVAIATQRKDIQINIAPCTIVGARLDPAYMLCKDTKTITLTNRSVSPLIITQQWDIFNNQGVSLFSSQNPSVTYSFSDTGKYTIKLEVNRGHECSDSTKAEVRVYPGFVPDFKFSGICYKKPTTFTDATTTVYGQVNSWNWDFGESDIAAGYSNNRNTNYTYAALGQKNVRMIAGNTVGCIDTIMKTVSILDKPPINLAFRDTLICVKDEVQLLASGSGNFSWSPSLNILNQNSAAPTVVPGVSTTYFVDLDEDGCLNRDSVKVRVTDHVSLQPMSDTVICKGDSIQFRLVSDGFKYSWAPASQIINPSVKNAIAITPFNTSYQVTAFIGSCVATASVLVSTVAYPVANAGPDTMICFNTFAHLHAVMDGKSFKWSPMTSLSNGSVLDPIAKPVKTTAYIFSAYDTYGCPKPGNDTVVVRVLDKIKAFAGRDTAVVVNQPLQLTASGGVGYSWSPSLGLSALNKSDPVAQYTQSSEGIRYKVLVYNEARCVDSAFVRVKVFKTSPIVFVPNAFTPNKNGSNDLLRPITAGMQVMEYFKIYNRWGQMVFSSGISSIGWDGTFGGKQQDAGMYVWMVKAKDYLGRPYFQKGMVALLR